MRRDVIVGTKVRLIPTDHDRIAEAITVSLENSLRRLRREQVDLLQLHNEISSSGRSDALDAVTVVDEMMPVFERLRSRGKIRFGGISCKGDADAIHRVITAGGIDTAQSGAEERDPRGSQTVVPMGSEPDYGADVRWARLFEPLVREAHATSLVDAALRFVAAERRIATVLVGFSTFDQLAAAVASINKDPLSSAVLNRMSELQKALANADG